MPDRVGSLALALILDFHAPQVFRNVRTEPATTIKCTPYREKTSSAATDRIPVRNGQPLQGWDTAGIEWDLGLGVGIGVTENKSKVLGGRRKIN